MNQTSLINRKCDACGIMNDAVLSVVVDAVGEGSFSLGLPVLLEEKVDAESFAGHDLHLLVFYLDQIFFVNGFSVIVLVDLWYALLGLSIQPQIFIDQSRAFFLLPFKKGNTIGKTQFL